MNPNDQRPVSEQEIANIQHTLDLLGKQIQAGRIEDDYALNQIKKVKTLITRLANDSKEQQSAGRFEVLYEVSRALGTSLDLETVLNQVMDAIIKLTGAERGFLMLSDDDGNLRIEVARNVDQRSLAGAEFDYSRTISNFVLDTGEAVLTTNATEDPRFRSGASVMTQSLRSIMAAPLWARGRIIGIAYVENRVIAGLFNEEHLTTLETLAGQASIAIDNAILFEETDEQLAQRVDELTLLRRIDLQLNKKLDPDEAMLYTLETACRIAEATAGHLGLLHRNSNHIIATHHYHRKQDSSHRDEPIYLDDAYPRAWDAIKTGETVIFDTGQFGLVSVLIVPIMREKNAIGVMVIKHEDGGVFSEAQQDLIERIVTRAAITIENAQLYDAIRQADKAKSEFVGVVAHDLKAPMTSIRGYADLLTMQGDNLDNRQQRFLGRISNTVNRMEMLVSDLSDISRIESGQFFMDEMQVPVKGVIEALNDTVMPEMQKRNHTYIEQVEDNLPDMYVDYYRLMQVLTNMLTNAYKYTPDGGKVSLRAQRVGDRIKFSIADTGIGLSEEGIAKLGTKFWRAEDEYTRSQQGTGLGFSITSALVEQMGSKINIQSELGEGSIFTFDVATYTGQDKQNKTDSD